MSEQATPDFCRVCGGDMRELRHEHCPKCGVILGNKHKHGCTFMSEQAKYVLTYEEGQIMTGADRSKQACWLFDGDEVVAAVVEGKDFDKSKAALRHAAHATQVLPKLIEALEKSLAMLNWHAIHSGDPVGTNDAIGTVLEALAEAKGTQCKP